MAYERFQLLSPAGLLIDGIEIEPDRVVIRARRGVAQGVCPNCQRPSARVHSRYERRLLDLPSHGRAVLLEVVVRRFRCANPGCRRRIFAEQLGDTVAGRSARRTCRLEAIIHYLGLALGGRPAANLARRLMLPVSKDTLLRVVRRKAACERVPLRVIGIDDWAWKRGQRYGSIICDLPTPGTTSSSNRGRSCPSAPEHGPMGVNQRSLVLAGPEWRCRRAGNLPAWRAAAAAGYCVRTSVCSWSRNGAASRRIAMTGNLSTSP